MNKTKRILIIVAIVLNFISCALNLYLGILFLLPPITSINIFYAIYQFLGVLAYVATSVLLLYSISNGGKNFKRRYNCYMTAVILSFLLNLFSVSSILLFITLFLPDIVWVKPHDDVYFVKEDEVKDEKTMSEREKERKIAALRKLKEEGKITEEEFKEELFKLL